MSFQCLPSDKVVFHEEAGEAFLLHVDTGEYFGLNPSGVIVWSALRDGLEPEQELAREWPDVPREVLREDAARLQAALLEAGLIFESGEPPGGA